MVQQTPLFDEFNDTASSQLPPADIKTMVNVGVREAFGLGYRDPDRVTYIESTVICQILLPSLFGDDVIFKPSQVSYNILVTLYEERAKAQSLIRKKKVTAIMLVDEYIAAIDQEITANPNGKTLQAELKKMQGLRRKLKGEKYTEPEVLERDVFLRRNYTHSWNGKGYVAFGLPHKRVLRLALFHPNPPEHSTGVDILYEHHCVEKKLVRIAGLQYKMSECGVLSISPEKERIRVEKQLDRMKQTFCDASYCTSPDGDNKERWFCSHYCSVFMRPTDRQQEADTRYTSIGYHIPICRFRDLWNASKTKRFSIQDFEGKSIKSQAFEELFNMNELGSRWLTYEELEEFHRKHKVLEPGDHIVIHAREFVGI